MTRGPAQLADHVASLDAARFVGRATILGWVDRLLAGETPLRVALIHGPGGIGKSALLREIGRRAERRHHRPIRSVDARTLEPVPGELENVLADATDRPGAVVLVDSFEHILAQDSLLRDRILPGLAADAVVVVAGRQAPHPAWFRGGWEHVSADVPLGPLPPREALALLAALGVTDPSVTGPLVDWADGSPLALNLAAGGAQGEVPDLTGVDLNRMILRRLAGDELGEIDGDVIQVAAVARAVDSRLLAAVLPGRPTRAANEALRRCSVAEPVGARVTLHDLVCNALRRDLGARDPHHYNQLRCRIADHLHARATAGETRLLSDLVELLDGPAVRWGLSADVTGRLRIDPWRPHEVDGLVEGYVSRMGDRRWWDDLARLLAHAPEMGFVARDLYGVPLAFCVATTAARAPAAAKHDPVLAPVLAQAQAQAQTGDRAMIFRESFGVSGASGQAAVGVLHLSAMLRSGEANIERSYILDTAVDAGSLAFFQAVGAVHDPRLDSDVDGRHVECWVVDHGPSGVLGQVRDAVHSEAGAPATSQTQRRDEDLHQAAVDALPRSTVPTPWPPTRCSPTLCSPRRTPTVATMRGHPQNPSSLGSEPPSLEPQRSASVRVPAIVCYARSWSSATSTPPSATTRPSCGSPSAGRPTTATSARPADASQPPSQPSCTAPPNQPARWTQPEGVAETQTGDSPARRGLTVAQRGARLGVAWETMPENAPAEIGRPGRTCSEAQPPDQT